MPPPYPAVLRSLRKLGSAHPSTMTIARVLIFALLGTACSHASSDDANTSVPSRPPFTMICGQEWMTRNLDVATYRNGDPIPQVKAPNEWVELKTGAWCWYNNDSAASSCMRPSS